MITPARAFRVVPRGFELQRKAGDGPWQPIAIFDDGEQAKRALFAELEATGDLDPTDPAMTDPCIELTELELKETG